LKPPKPPTPGPIVIKQEANIPTAPAPPNPPEPIPPKTIVIPGVRLPPPPRRVIIERLAPEPPQAQPVSVERWLPYDKRERRVVLEPKPCDPCVEKPKNGILFFSSFFLKSN